MVLAKEDGFACCRVEREIQTLGRVTVILLFFISPYFLAVLLPWEQWGCGHSPHGATCQEAQDLTVNLNNRRWKGMGARSCPWWVPTSHFKKGNAWGGVTGMVAGITLLTSPRVLADERRAVCGRLCPAGPQLAAGRRRRPAARRSLREESLHPGWLHADSSRQVTGTLLFGVERWGFPGVLPGSQHPGSQQQEALATPTHCQEKKKRSALCFSGCLLYPCLQNLSRNHLHPNTQLCFRPEVQVLLAAPCSGSCVGPGLQGDQAACGQGAAEPPSSSRCLQ